MERGRRRPSDGEDGAPPLRSNLSPSPNRAKLGYALGTFLIKSVSLPPALGGPLVPPGIAMTFALMTLLRNDYGELIKRTGCVLLLLWGRMKGVRERYPTNLHIKSLLKLGPRTPFPPLLPDPNAYEDDDEAPVENPWTYRPRLDMYDVPPSERAEWRDRGDDPDFAMLPALLALAVLGGIVGAYLPIPVVPSWMCSLGGAAVTSYIATLRKARGDLARTAGMRMVALLKELRGIDDELDVTGTAGSMAIKIFDKMMILDRKHRIRDRVGVALRFAGKRRWVWHGE